MSARTLKSLFIVVDVREKLEVVRRKIGYSDASDLTWRKWSSWKVSLAAHFP
jgi:hypothetical protein